METIPILQETAEWMAVDKPEGIPVAHTPESESLLTIFQRRLGTKLWVVHRLDKDVSGIFLLAKTAEMHKWLSRQFELRRVEKTYMALVLGRIHPDRGIIENPIRCYGSGRMGIDKVSGKPAKTEWNVDHRFASSTLLEVRPRTGRRHQIRVHLYSIGHPIAGDRRYGERLRQKDFPRLMLHALRLSWIEPTGENRSVSSPLPDAFHSVLSEMRKNDSGKT